MMKFNREEGLTLIELLITISVLAIVSAIALPVVNNVVSSSNSNALEQTRSDVTDFVAKYNAAGAVMISVDPTNNTVISGYVDTDGDNAIDSNELIDTLTIDGSKFTAGSWYTGAQGTYTSDVSAPYMYLKGQNGY